MTRLVIGCGTGRCGTVSLSKIFHQQKDVVATHENCLMPWTPNWTLCEQQYRSLKNREPFAKLSVDVAFYWLPYVEQLIQLDHAVKFICLKRDKDQTVKSYLQKTKNRALWQSNVPEKMKKNIWYDCYPSFETENKQESIELYWELYYKTARLLETKYPQRFRIVKTEALNDRAQVIDILEWCGLDDPVVSPVPVHSNAIINKPALKTISDNLVDSLFDAAKRVDKSFIETNQTVWLFWGGPLPAHISQCMKTIIEKCGKFHPRLVTPENVHQYIDLPPNWSRLQSWAQKADILRFGLLQQYGGIYIDCDCVAIGRLDQIFAEKNTKDFYCCLNREKVPSIGFLCAKKGSRVCKYVFEAQKQQLDRANVKDSNHTKYGSFLVQNIIKKHQLQSEITSESMFGRTSVCYWDHWMTLTVKNQTLQNFVNVFKLSPFCVHIYNHGSKKTMRNCAWIEDSHEEPCADQNLPKLTICIKTYERHMTCVETVKEFVKVLPDASFLIVDDSTDTEQEKVNFAAKLRQHTQNVFVIRIPCNSGLSMGRNVLLQYVQTEYFLLTDDDLHLETVAPLQESIDFLEKHPTCDLVAGKTHGNEKQFCLRRDAHSSKTMVHSKTPKTTVVHGDSTFSQYDFVENIFVGRTSSFRCKNVTWNAKLKVSEHLEFFWRNRNTLTSFFNANLVFYPTTTAMADNARYLDARQKQKQYFWKIACGFMDIERCQFET